jgi:hypothetical protein
MPHLLKKKTIKKINPKKNYGWQPHFDLWGWFQPILYFKDMWHFLGVKHGSPLVWANRM